jgi:eukaryotic-like serine/threonine-protein kinase
MALTVGARLGPYEIIGTLGAGGMGEVYRARDTRLKRDVAIKILPESFATDPERLARFQREAEVLASLNHPNIAAIHGLEESNGTGALVMELVEGETLADRIAQGPIPVDEALAIARQIAEALEAAHEQGIVHRDLKPANVKVRADGTVKVLDFGLAKALEPASALSPSATASPTITSPAMMTGVGTLLGTAAYMSPEQARGKPVDKRSDIWAFGCVLFEMLTGQRAFEGKEITDVLARVLEREVHFDAIPAATPPAVQRLARRCLEKDPRRRLRDIGEARVELEVARSNDTAVSSTVSQASKKGLTVPTWAAWVAAAVVGVLIAAAAAGWQRDITGPPATVSRFVIPVPSGYQMMFGQTPSLAISPDGTSIVFETQGRLYLRTLNRFETAAIPGTDGAIQPFFSPDGVWLGFVRGNTLMKAPVAGGPAVKITEAFQPLGVAWGRDGRIVFAGALGNGGLWAVSANGGMPEQVTFVSESDNETQHIWPDALPDGSVLYTVVGPSGHATDARLVVEDLVRSRRTVVAEGVTYGRYLMSGHLLYADADGTLLLQPFDLAGQRTTGPARAVLTGARTSSWGGAVPYAVSSTGTLVYATGTEFAESVLVELDLSGRERRRFGTPGSFGVPALSPDGSTLAMSIRSPSNDDIYLLDVASGRFDRFSFDVAEDESPVWSPDGRHIAYSSASVGEQRRIFVKTIGSTEPERLLYTGKRHLHLGSWSPDGRWLAFHEYHPRSIDAWVLNVNDTTKLVPVATTPANEEAPVFSPDGRWLAYASNETGRYETYVVSFPDLRAKQQVSRDGGYRPTWSSTGGELFFFDRLYLSSGRLMMATRVTSAGAIEWQQPQPLFEVPRVYDVAIAGDRRSVYFLAPNPDGPAREINVVVNWLRESLTN